MRHPTTNPFLPGSDAVPPVWAGRALELADFREVATARRRAGIYERGRIVLGEAGIGKSVLVNRMAAELEEDGGWVLPQVRIAVGDDAVVRVTRAAQALLSSRSAAAAVGETATRLLDRISEVTVLGSGVRLRSDDVGPTHELLAQLLVELAKAAREAAAVLFVRIDEVQNLEGRSLSALLTALGDLLNATVDTVDVVRTRHREHLPVLVYLSGLPEFHARASAAGATFARRFKPVELGALDRGDMLLALRPFLDEGWRVIGSDGPELVRMEVAAADAIIDASHGSPFLFQLVGEAAWNAGAGSTITAEEARRGIASSAREISAHFRLRLASLTELQRRYLDAAATIDDDRERTAGRVAEALGMTSARLASTAQSLDARHRLIRRLGGRIVFRSPGLAEHLRGEPA